MQRRRGVGALRREVRHGQLRTDLEPLTKRFPALDTPEQVRWLSGTYGDGRAPGPSTYWIDAVITLSQNKTDELKTFHTSAGLDKAFSHDTWVVKAYLVPDDHRLVLVATGT